MKSLIEFDSSPMVSPIETMHFDSTLSNPIGLHRFLPRSELHFDVFGGFVGPQIWLNPRGFGVDQRLPQNEKSMLWYRCPAFWGKKRYCSNL